MTSPGTTDDISSTGAPISCANATTGTTCPSASCGSIATLPDKITYIAETASPEWNKSSPAGNRLTSPKRLTRSISMSERTGNIWWNRDARAALDVAGPAGVAFSNPSWSLRSLSLGKSDPSAGVAIAWPQTRYAPCGATPGRPQSWLPHIGCDIEGDSPKLVIGQRNPLSQRGPCITRGDTRSGRIGAEEHPLCPEPPDRRGPPL